MDYRIKEIVATIKNKEITKLQKTHILKEKFKKILFGSNDRKGILSMAIVYALLICIGFVYLYPLLYMFVTSMKPLSDLLDTSIKWIPSKIYINNYIQAMSVMSFKSTILDSFYVALVPTICQVIVCALVGYGFARYEFKGKNVFIVLIVFTLVIPPQITMMPTYVLFSDLHLIGSIKAFILPAMLGQGLKSAIFILIYYQFFRQTPKALYEAAEIDGAGHLSCFFKIAIPTAIPAIIVVFLFSFVWHWNESYLTALYLSNSGLGGSQGLSTILLQLKQFETNYSKIYPATSNSPNRINEAIQMAGTIISIAPLLITYFVLQRHFVESIDNTGITGE